MELRTHLGQDRFFWMKDELTRADRAALLVEAVAPAMAAPEGAAPTNLVVVLDRSGSMDGAPLDHATRALRDVVDRLSPADSFGLVIFDDQVDVVVPAGPVSDRAAIKRAIDGVTARSMTDLGAGLIEGLRQAKRLGSDAGVRVLLVSDGHANSGVTDPTVLRNHVGQHLDSRITTSTLGMGLGYDESLLSAIARAGSGNEHFAEEADTAAGVIVQECGDLLSQRFLSCSLTVTMGSGMESVEVINEATQQPIPHGIRIELGGFQPEQIRSLVLRFTPKQASRPGRRKVAMLRLDYILADDLSDHSVSTSVWARVARDDERGAVVDADVMAEVLFQRVQRRKRAGMQALSMGDYAKAESILNGVVRLIKRHWASIPRSRRPEFADEIDFIDGMTARAGSGMVPDMAFASKLMSSDINVKSRARGRGRA
jgi:Ca-activated chloride channel family protein